MTEAITLGELRELIDELLPLVGADAPVEYQDGSIGGMVGTDDEELHWGISLDVETREESDEG